MDAVLEAALQIGDAAQELHLVLLQLALPLDAPLRPVIPNILQFLSHFLSRRDALGQFGQRPVVLV